MSHTPNAGEATPPNTPFTMPRNIADETHLVQLAFDIANRAVVEDIESNCAKQSLDDGRIWWDTRLMLDPREHCPEIVDMAIQAIQYAIGVGLAHVHPGRPYLITIVTR